MRRIIARLGTYGVSVAVTLLVGLVSVPALIHVAGPTAWAGIAVVQAIAGFAGVLIGFGWTATGPSLIATAATTDRPLLLWRSLVVRSLIAAIVIPIACLVGTLLAGLPPAVTITAVIAYALPALGAAWFFVGEARPRRFLLLDTVPRALAVLGGIVGLWLTHDLLAFSSVMLVVGAVGLVVAYWTALGTAPGIRSAPLRIRQTLVEQRHGMTTTATAALYVNSPLIVASMVLTGGIESFALATRIFGYAIAGFQPVLQVAQGWVPGGPAGSTPERTRHAASLAVRGSLIAMVGTALLMPILGAVLSTGLVRISYSLSIPFGVCVGAVVVSQIVGLACLTAVGEQRVLATSTVIGAVVGLVLLFVLAIAAGVSGLAWALAAAECLVTAWQLLGLRKFLRRD